MNPWKDLLPGPDVPHMIHVVVEIPKGSRNIDLRFFKVTITTPSRYIGSRKATRQSPFPFVPAKR